MGECCNNKEDISLSCHCGANDSFKSNSSQLKCQKDKFEGFVLC